VLAGIDGQPATAAAARHVVSRLFRADFVPAMPSDDQVSFVRSLYELYSAVPDLRVEAPGVDLDEFLPGRDARWFAYLDDAEEFYQKGPAFSGRTITYAMAGQLLLRLHRTSALLRASLTNTIPSMLARWAGSSGA